MRTTRRGHINFRNKSEMWHITANLILQKLVRPVMGISSTCCAAACSRIWTLNFINSHVNFGSTKTPVSLRMSCTQRTIFDPFPFTSVSVHRARSDLLSLKLYRYKTWQVTACCLRLTLIQQIAKVIYLHRYYSSDSGFLNTVLA
jgi:hypothetical protein